MKIRLPHICLFLLATTFICGSCTNKTHDNYFLRIYEGEHFELGVQSGYINLTGDTVIALGKYYHCYTDTMRNFGIVLTQESKCLAVDLNEKVLFEVFWYDNGPDYIKDGLFRIKQDGKVGYANTKGEIVIPPKFDCAFPFNAGIAKVSVSCTSIADGEHIRWESDKWFYIDTTGKEIEKQMFD